MLLVLVTLGPFELTAQTCRQGCDDDFNTWYGDESFDNNTTGQFNAAFGRRALQANSTGTNNAAFGELALYSNTDGSDNTAVGDEALAHNSHGVDNTAIGAAANGSVFTGSYNTAVGAQALTWATGNYNTAVGQQALYTNHGNTYGANYYNTAIGAGALSGDNIGSYNTALGYNALYNNSSGNYNTASGMYTLYSNTSGSANAATGIDALYFNTTGYSNTADGQDALYRNTTGAYNTAIGHSALSGNTSGSTNIAVGDAAGSLLTTGSNNIDIGNKGVAVESGAIRIGTVGTQTATFIAGIRGTTVAGGIAVLVDANGRLGTTTSSARFKDQIKPMAKASESILELEPVTFHYKKELDPDGIPQFGLVAEEVAKVNPDLVVRDEQGKPYTVRYEAVNAMLLNEFLKAHRRLEEQARINQRQEATIARLETALKGQAAQIQKVSAQMQIDRAAPRVVQED